MMSGKLVKIPLQFFGEEDLDLDDDFDYDFDEDKPAEDGEPAQEESSSTAGEPAADGQKNATEGGAAEDKPEAGEESDPDEGEDDDPDEKEPDKGEDDDPDEGEDDSAEDAPDEGYDRGVEELLAELRANGYVGDDIITLTADMRAKREAREALDAKKEQRAVNAAGKSHIKSMKPGQGTSGEGVAGFTSKDVAEVKACLLRSSKDGTRRARAALASLKIAK